MLTDIFAARYADVPMWNEFREQERRLLVQAFHIVKDHLFPFYTQDGKERDGAKATWTSMHDRLKVELGLKELSSQGYWGKRPVYGGGEQSVWQPISMLFVCEGFVCAPYNAQVPADTFIKERLSFIEIAFRDRENELAKLNAELPAKIVKAGLDAKLSPPRGQIRVPGDPVEGIKAWNRIQNETFRGYVDELNERFRQAGARINYHNGFIQISDDEQIESQIETPFWTLLKDPKWVNVDTDMKESIDLRDTGGRDPAFYAARALESAIKIISGEKGWTRGDEKGAAGFINNLVSQKNGRFISAWEGDALKAFFSDVRNELGHGPGGEPMPELTAQQTDWAIEFCMSWIKSLIKRM